MVIYYFQQAYTASTKGRKPRMTKLGFLLRENEELTLDHLSFGDSVFTHLKTES